jgi:hypothetical protein
MQKTQLHRVAKNGRKRPRIHLDRNMLGSLPPKNALGLRPSNARPTPDPSIPKLPTARFIEAPPKFPADGLPNLVVLTLIQPGFRL